MIGFRNNPVIGNLPDLHINTNVGLGITGHVQTPRELLNYQSNILFVLINGISPSII
jgi:hypothetical protein